MLLFRRRLRTKRRELTVQEIIAAPVTICLSILHYDGTLREYVELVGSVRAVSPDAIHVDLPSGVEVRLVPDLSVLHGTAATGLSVHVGSVGIPYRTELRHCLYRKP